MVSSVRQRRRDRQEKHIPSKKVWINRELVDNPVLKEGESGGDSEATDSNVEGSN